jgi:site-specific DNA-methyltransferase (adenine-specific)
MDDIKRAGINIFDPAPFLEVLQSVFENGKHSSFIFCNKPLVHKYLNYAVENGLSYNILVWKKSNVVPFGDSHFPDIEYLIFIRKNAKWNNGTSANRSKVLVYDQDLETQKDFPTPKPLPLVENELVLTTSNGDVVVDFFLGSGTTLVACENLKRKGRAIEISPAYCSVTLERMHTAFPELVIQRENNE